MTKRFDRKVRGGWTPDEIYDHEMAHFDECLENGSLSSEQYLKHLSELSDWYDEEVAALANV